MIQVEHLTKRYGDTAAVDDISFSVEKGEIVGFLGPNGAGKSTTMRMLTCYLPATSGSATVAGHDIFNETLAIRREVGYLPETLPIYPELKVAEFLDFRARLKGVARKERKAAVERVMERCWIRDKARVTIGHLSKGYRQRVGLADALLGNPPILILDEPTVGLDPNQIREVRSLIQELGREHTVILSTHILQEVDAVCTRAIIIHRGRIVAADSLENLRKGYGQRSRIRVEVREDSGRVESALRAIPGVQEVSLAAADGTAATEWHQLTVECPLDADLRPEIWRVARDAGWTLRELHLDNPTLEDIFLRATLGGELPAAAATAAVEVKS